jgi:hypothetical protein
MPRDGWQMTASAGALREFCHFDPRPFGRRLLIRLHDGDDKPLDK